MSPYKHSASKKHYHVACYTIKSVHTRSKKNMQTLGPMKENLVLIPHWIYYIPSECCKIYVGQTCKTIQSRSKEHLRYLHLGQGEKSAMAEHVIDVGQYRNLTSPYRLNAATSYMDGTVKKAIEITIHPQFWTGANGSGKRRLRIKAKHSSHQAPSTNPTCSQACMSSSFMLVIILEVWIFGLIRTSVMMMDYSMKHSLT